MTCTVCSNTIESHLVTISGVLSASVSLLTHKATIHYEPDLIGIRTLIEEIECLGFGARYEPQSDKQDVRTIIRWEVQKYRQKFTTSLVLILPIWVLMWIVPYVYPHLVTTCLLCNDVPAFVYVVGFFSTIIQVFMGTSFYVNAYKSVKNKTANMDVLVVLGTTSAWTYATAMLFIGYNE